MIRQNPITANQNPVIESQNHVIANQNPITANQKHRHCEERSNLSLVDCFTMFAMTAECYDKSKPVIANQNPIITTQNPITANQKHRHCEERSNL